MNRDAINARLAKFIKRKDHHNEKPKTHKNKKTHGHADHTSAKHTSHKGIHSLAELQEQVKRLQNAPQHEQRTESWYAARKLLITASEAASALNKTKQVCEDYINAYQIRTDKFILDPTKGCNPYMTLDEFYLKKCGEIPFTGNIATRWGQKYEDVAANAYARLYGTKLLEFGLIQHPKLGWLGASPDGITTDGVMLEIKCPYRRKITGVPPFYYWVQVQLQLEVCNLRYCDFLECTFDTNFQYVSTADFLKEKVETWDLSKAKDHYGEAKVDWEKKCLDKGLILWQKPLKQNGYEDYSYYYPPAEMSDPHELLEWAEEEIKKVRAALTIQKAWKRYHKHTTSYRYKLRPMFWKLIDIHIAKIERSTEWFSKARPILYEAYNKMLWYQEYGTSQIHTRMSAKKKRKSKPKMVGKTVSLSSWVKKPPVQSTFMLLDTDDES